MSEWGIALIAAGSAILGSITTGFFAWKAGHRQAAAAEAAGQAQAQALIATVQATLDEQRRARADERRRHAYADFLDAAQIAHLTFNEDTMGRMASTESMVHLEGPDSVGETAHLYLKVVGNLHAGRIEGDAVEDARLAYMEAALHALVEA
ncbi:hypothetical protein ACFQ69_17580 [Streptomyces sp. NPDC056470]|uniref:hypothetical protein n=1 Tax=Streptomyces sp. NPDC056470 TaxID=3345831 RepID=UPI0036A71292